MSAIPLHGLASRHDLPLPFALVLLGAAAALVLSFVVLTTAWRGQRYPTLGGLPLPRLTRVVDAPAVRLVASVAVLALYGWVGLALAVGPDRLTNPSFGFVYVWMWVGLVPASLVFGTWWRATNPLRTIHAGLCRVARVDPNEGLVTLSPRVGVWPAAAGLLAFGWLELVQPDRTTLPVLRLWAAVWLTALVLGAVVCGARWIGAADPFETYATTVASLSPWRRRDGELRLVHPLAGLTAWEPPPGTPAAVSVLLGSTAFDSFANTSWWIASVQGSAVPSVLWDTGGLLGMALVVFATFSAAACWMERYAADRTLARSAYPRRMAGSLVPIVVGYAVAHYATLLVVEGQRTAINLSDPLGRGWNVFGSAEMGVNSAIYNYPGAVAWLQLSAILGGHLLGIVAAHQKAVSLLPPTAARRGQWPMLAVMIGYTWAGLVLLFSP